MPTVHLFVFSPAITPGNEAEEWLEVLPIQARGAATVTLFQLSCAHLALQPDELLKLIVEQLPFYGVEKDKEDSFFGLVPPLEALSDSVELYNVYEALGMGILGAVSSYPQLVIEYVATKPRTPVIHFRSLGFPISAPSEHASPRVMSAPALLEPTQKMLPPPPIEALTLAADHPGAPPIRNLVLATATEACQVGMGPKGPKRPKPRGKRSVELLFVDSSCYEMHGPGWSTASGLENLGAAVQNLYPDVKLSQCTVLDLYQGDFVDTASLRICSERCKRAIVTRSDKSVFLWLTKPEAARCFSFGRTADARTALFEFCSPFFRSFPRSWFDSQLRSVLSSQGRPSKSTPVPAPEFSQVAIRLFSPV